MPDFLRLRRPLVVIHKTEKPRCQNGRRDEVADQIEVIPYHFTHQIAERDHAIAHHMEHGLTLSSHAGLPCAVSGIGPTLLAIRLKELREN
ncbi:hypothetical protein [Acuticoccus kandeliae]|uniref:hypothetical protein n=1 Tax=Acuticoccus kandeliae TaxID=2073160 RepID=UPI001300530D|nr:hypothetical protein [Acuticoccus kandeliae]